MIQPIVTTGLLADSHQYAAAANNDNQP